MIRCNILRLSSNYYKSFARSQSAVAVRLSPVTDMENIAPNVMNNRKFTLAVEGNIGSGKSTFLKHFTNNNDITVMTEPIDKWTNLGGKHNLLELIYQDPTRWNMAFQSYVQLTRLQMHTLKVETTYKFMERSLYSARHCFVQNYIDNDMITDCERHIVDEWFAFITQTQDVKLDLIVYLRTDPIVALERTRKRNRHEETSIPLEYLECLHRLHDNWLHNGGPKVPCPVIELDANQNATDVIAQFNQSLASQMSMMKPVFDFQRKKILA